ncbi:MAG: ABC transporter substrate-binding protein [Bacteriovoracaceae bacterium]|nr:ABC transporter substrate-binding protein [Bacteriovoracaceae bacterium]
MHFLHLLLLTFLVTESNARILRVAVPNAILSLDPSNTTTAQERFLLPLLYQPLFYIDQNSSIQPVLAETYEQKKANIIRIRLRKNQIFSDMTEVTSEDIVTSVNILCGKATYNLIPIRTLVGCKKNEAPQIKAVSKYEVDFTIRGSTNYFLYELASPFLFIFKTTSSGPIGSGLFKLKAMLKDEVILARVNQKKDLPNELSLIYIKEKEISNALNSNKIDIASMYVESKIPELHKTKFQKITSSNNVTTILTLNPLKIKTVPSKLLKQISNEMRTDAELAKCDVRNQSASGVVPEGIGGHVDYQVSQPEKNPVRLKNSLKLNIHQAADRLISCETSAVKNIFNRHNIEVTIVYDTDYNHLIQQYGKETIDGYIEHFVFYTRDAGRFYTRFTSSANTSIFYINSKKIEELLKNAENISEIQKRFQIYRDINHIIDGYHHIFALTYMGHSIIWSKCVGFKDSSDDMPLNPNTFLFLSDVFIKDCK